MPRIPEDPPDFQTFIREDFEFSIGSPGSGADLTWPDVRTLQNRIAVHNAHAADGKQAEKLNLAHLKALIAVMRAFPGSAVLLGVEGLR